MADLASGHRLSGLARRSSVSAIHVHAAMAALGDEVSRGARPAAGSSAGLRDAHGAEAFARGPLPDGAGRARTWLRNRGPRNADPAPCRGSCRPAAAGRRGATSSAGTMTWRPENPPTEHRRNSRRPRDAPPPRGRRAKVRRPPARCGDRPDARYSRDGSRSRAMAWRTRCGVGPAAALVARRKRRMTFSVSTGSETSA